ncbi:Xaa-Pro aminopeptidase [Gluconacetobacter liquefaciens]|uniref:Aminopeptidase P family protein n=1 Tax=Gluconacetobacter liquefaciens TaxID=89584 RepID=A0A370G6L8_GLULI|nr:aminopeptidase P family protein [Gluconacetobacter liquefaciens]MBB2186180.1 aminopeptidase P family protein [Gluconacetobacter liquefaciens]RDI38716.1 Xaa-Pro aminopeptidase [Gluconacetobacter liquefaciens]GEB36356.1 Xaa-Pro aminopeptidase [Gluconacetobacter liquefaciens]
MPEISARLPALRRVLEEMDVDGFLLLRGDEHLGEYVAPYAERLAWLSGFTGSAGMAVVLRDGPAAVFSDGRYITQMDQQVDGTAWARLHMRDTPPAEWLAAQGGRGLRIGYDPRLVGEAGLQPFLTRGLDMVPLAANPVDRIWTDQPAAPGTPCLSHPLSFAGEDSADKRARMAAVLRAEGQDAAIVGDPTSVAWLLNIRGSDVPYTPACLAFAILHADAQVDLFIDPARVPPDTAHWLGPQVRIVPPSGLDAALTALAGQTVRVDPVGTAVWFIQTLEATGATIARATDPCALPRACKNPVEQEGARRAHLIDGIALCRFLHWVDTQGVGQNELEAATRLNAFRALCPDYREESFPAISGAGPNGAVIHYRVTPDTARTIGTDEVYLIDSGGQYPFGTTDVTRTLWTGKERGPDSVRGPFTRVLKGHIALARARFPVGTTGHALDALARYALWQDGLDYDHGTGHGIGSYLSVHEGPCSISPVHRPVAVATGMILSDEPGYYRPGAFGIRLENLLLVHPTLAEAGRNFLAFETLTLAPFDRRLIDPSLLTREETAWLDTYHARVFDLVAPQLASDARAWLEAACAPIVAD